ncbi:MAG: glycerol-3-phosphate 1-O-acyltransferase PlsY [Phycisphaerales bacterium]|nr:glycerol-3-phosphate 1-O-acyltransferase PlsY [Phycisphaerales bacterium]
MPVGPLNPAAWPALLAAAFLAGSIPTGLLIGRAKGIDIRRHGSGNIGATNITRVLGKGPGALCFAIDIAKGLIPTLVAGWVLGRLGQLRMPAADAWMWLAAMLAPVLGHIFCPWLKFKGGKGVATGLGVLLGVVPALTIPALLTFATWLAIYKTCRYVSLASLTAGLSLPLWTLAMFMLWPGRAAGDPFPPPGSGPFLIVTTAMTLLVFWTHRANIRRLLKGQELRATKK